MLDYTMTTSYKTLLQDGDINKSGHDELVFDPYNPANKEISVHQVGVFLKKYGVPDTVHNINLYKRAFVHKSYVKRPHLENIDRGVYIVDQPGNCLRCLWTRTPDWYIYESECQGNWTHAGDAGTEKIIMGPGGIGS